MLMLETCDLLSGLNAAPNVVCLVDLGVKGGRLGGGEGRSLDLKERLSHKHALIVRTFHLGFSECTAIFDVVIEAFLSSNFDSNPQL